MITAASTLFVSPDDLDHAEFDLAAFLVEFQIAE
jgi:hypothetical protein